MTRDAAVPRTAVLLGAGASVDAGLPTTVTFARELVTAVRDSFGAPSPITQTLNFIYGAMLNHRTEQGGDPFAAVNMETMISAIRLLRERDSHEVAPFIRGWKPQVGRYQEDYRSNPGDILVRAIRSDDSVEMSGSVVLDTLVNLVHDVVGDVANSGLYEQLEQALRAAVRDRLLRTTDVTYLTPLIDFASAQPGGLDVPTLNYDLTVESCASANGIIADRGEYTMSLGTPTGFDPSAPLRLYKIHGSIDLREDVKTRTGTRRPRIIRDETTAEFAPSIVIGDRDKLGSGGRTLALLAAFAHALHDTTRLVIVGYSFADSHINDLITDWLSRDLTRTLTVLDPSWPSPRPSGYGFRTWLTEELTETPRSRIHVIRDTTAQALGRALTESPLPQPNPRFAVTVTWDELTATLCITNPGEAVEDFDIAPSFRGNRPEAMTVEHSDATMSRTVHNEWTVPLFATGDVLEVRATFDSREHLAPFRLDGHDSTRRLQMEIRIDDHIAGV